MKKEAARGLYRVLCQTTGVGNEQPGSLYDINMEAICTSYEQAVVVEFDPENGILPENMRFSLNRL